jgi:hypothetical protein
MISALRPRLARLVAGILIAFAMPAAAHAAVVVTHGYFPLPDGTQLNYTLTLPHAGGHYPVLLEYGPYGEGATSDPSYAPNGYAMLGVNFRGTGCSQGVFQPLRSDIWGRDGADVVNWAGRQPWSTGSVGMFGFSFTGTSQLATAEYAGPALKAIMPFNVFPDAYRDMVYPGGIYNSWIAAWVAAARQFAVGLSSFEQTPNDSKCAAHEAGQAAPNEAQSADTGLHPFLDSYWVTQPDTFASRIHVPVLGCVNWQDTTVHSYAFDAYRRLPPRTTWVVGGDGAHSDCPVSHVREVSFLDHYVKHADNRWQRTPHLVLEHEIPTSSPGEGLVDDNAAPWTTGFQTWADVNRDIKPMTLYLRAGGQLSSSAPKGTEPADSYRYGVSTNNTPGDFGGNDSWTRPGLPGGEVTYTTPVLKHDGEFLGSGSANLWVVASAPDSDVQITLSEVRPDGQEQYVENGWLRLSHRRLDPALSTVLSPIPTDRQGDAQPLTPLAATFARIQMAPFDHVFRAGSKIRLTIDTPGGWFAIYPVGVTNKIEHTAAMPSALVLGLVPGAAAHAPLPACGKLINQPCRPVTGTTPAGTLTLP